MPSTVPQRTISISITGTDKDAQVRYSYWSPVTGESFLNAPICDLSCNQPTYCLYVLDFMATQNGWSITGTSPNGDSPVLTQVPGAYHLSVLTFNPHTTDTQYRFFINYHNSLTGVDIQFDPQETNIPR